MRFFGCHLGCSRLCAAGSVRAWSATCELSLEDGWPSTIWGVKDRCLAACRRCFEREGSGVLGVDLLRPSTFLESLNRSKPIGMGFLFRNSSKLKVLGSSLCFV